LASLALLTACGSHAQDDRTRAEPGCAEGGPAGGAHRLHPSGRPEDMRDRQGEAQIVMDLAQIAPGMTVADIGAGEGYYAVRLAAAGRGRRAGCWRRISTRAR